MHKVTTYNKFYHYVPKDPQDMTLDELNDEMESCKEYEQECIRIGQGINSKENLRERRVRAELNSRKDSYKASYEDMPCIECGALVDGEGVFSTGTPLEHYTPSPGELLKNIWMECRNCGWNQYS